ncbi:hypothetical protein MMC10_005598 [Thelotrema lepadinum]|nr:hypothetical protein [Thelotrema lepadinum]
MFKLSALVGILLAAPSVFADLKCASLTPQGFKNNHVKAYFYGFQGYTAPTLPANTSVGTPWTLSNHNTSTGATLHVKTCNSTSLSTPGTQIHPSTQSSCGHGGCYTQFTNYIQLLNPSTGHCLTALNYNASLSATGFKPCNTDPKNLAQLWETDQQVDYPLGGNVGNPSSYGTVEFSNIEVANTPDYPPDPPFLAWALSGDLRGVQVKQFGYTQDGVLAELLQA